MKKQMKKLFSLLVMALLVVSVMPLVLAEGDDADGGIEIIVEEPENRCPEIYQDYTQRSWYPNDQTIYTAEEYGTPDTNCYGDQMYEVEDRGNYVFAGETLTYYVIVEDEDGDDDIGNVFLQGFGGCLEIDPPVDGEIATCTDSDYSTWSSYVMAKYGVEWDAATMNLYKCMLIVPAGPEDWPTITVQAEDVDDESCYVYDEKERITFNPDIGVNLEGSISFGSVEAGATATSNTIKIQNLIMQADGVIMDMYIASDDYFTSDNQYAICGDGNGIKYDQFSYYATKGSVDSGSNNNNYPGLGETSGICSARPDEFTPMPSHSGEITDMCRIINHLPKGSFLNQGDFMSLTLRLDVPANCEPYAYTNGQFHVVGRVV